jgi:transcriptional antiterminator NusG
MSANLLNRWFAVQVKTQSEKMVEALLTHKGYEVFLPVYQIQRPRGIQSRGGPKPLFPGYLFCRLATTVSTPIVTTPGVIRIIGSRRGEPVDDCEIERLKTVVTSGLPIRPWPKLEEGEAVEVICGPLRGCRGVFGTYGNKDQLVISLTLLQRSLTVTIQRNWIVPAENARRGPQVEVHARNLRDATAS